MSQLDVARIAVTSDRCSSKRKSPVVSRPRMLPLATLAMVAWWSATGFAIEIVSIEEHWELTIGEPDAGSSSPQICMVMSPTGHLDGDYFVFTINHHTHPVWAPGGMQLQRWHGDEIVLSRDGPIEGVLNRPQEVVRWVQRTKISDGSLIFEVVSGQSESWGTFGDVGHLRCSVETHLVNLNGYQPAISLEESGVSFAGNRVASLVLRKLRWSDPEGHVFELNAPIDVDADLDP